MSCSCFEESPNSSDPIEDEGVDSHTVMYSSSGWRSEILKCNIEKCNMKLVLVKYIYTHYKQYKVRCV